MRVLVTGCAGFIGSHLTELLLEKGNSVIGVDNFNSYYDPLIKEQNIVVFKDNKNFKLHRSDFTNFESIKSIFNKEKPQIVVHLGARAGVRPSIINPLLYTEVNKLGTSILLKLSVDFGVGKFIFASSSSVYGNSKSIPFSENDSCTSIISPYGASKRSAEMMVETFSRTFGLSAISLRFFTVYGPKGRPDMAPAIFSHAILANEYINRYGAGDTVRDYTYIEDIVDGIERAIHFKTNFEIFNLGNNNPISLKDFISQLELISGKRAKIRQKDKQMGDVEATWANIEKAKNFLDWTPRTTFFDGLEKYFFWLKNSFKSRT